MPTFSRHAALEWRGDVPRGAGEPSGATTPEELLAASHTAYFGNGFRSVLAARSGSAGRVHVTATVTVETRAHGIRLQAPHLDATVEGLAGVAPDAPPAIARHRPHRRGGLHDRGGGPRGGRDHGRDPGDRSPGDVTAVVGGSHPHTATAPP